jgi:outer membrane protein assembly factor BamD (BamD/ComL family)
MTTRIGILLYLFILLTTGGKTAAQGVSSWPELNDRIQKQIDIGECQQALFDALPPYRKLAREKYELHALHAYARNLAIINRAAQETVALLAKAGTAGGSGPLLDAKVFYRSLINLGQVKPFPTDGLTPDEAKFLALLQTATMHSFRQSVAEALGEGTTPSRRDYLFAYLLAAREPGRIDRLIEDLPMELRTPPTLHAFADYCASVERKDLAAAICMESGKRSVAEAEASTFYNNAAELFSSLNDIGGEVEALRRIVTRFPESPKAPDTQIRLIDLIADQWKSYGTAIKECETFLEKFPNSDKADAIKLKIGYLYYQNKNYDRAIEYFSELAKDPKMAGMDVQRRFFLAFCYMGKGENDTATDLLSQIVAKHPEHPLAPRAQFVLAKSYLSRQDYAKAQYEFKSLVTIYPNSEYAKQADDLLKRLSQTLEKKTGADRGGSGEAGKKGTEKQ